MNRTRALTMLQGARFAVGALSWASPRVAGRLFGLDTAANAQLPYMARLFGARDFALGWGALSSEGEAQRKWLLAGLACDIADTLAGIAGGRDGSLSKSTSVMVTGVALVGVGLGSAALASE